MSEESERAKDRRKGTREVIDKLTNERTEMLVLFCRVAGLEPYTSDKPVESLLQEFCQVLVDYIAAGHFSLYERIINGKERRQGLVDLAEKLYPRIAKTTDAVLTFNDKYDTPEKNAVLSELSDDLSDLGQQLAIRVDLEDRLLEVMKPQERPAAAD